MFIFCSIGQSLKYGLIEVQIRNPGAVHVFNKFVNREKGRVSVEHVFVLTF